MNMENLYLRPQQVLLCLLCFAVSVHSQSSPDAASMQTLKSSLKLTSGLDWSDPDPCQWTNVQCDKSTRRVTRIQLVRRGVQGKLPPDLKNLTSLRILELMNNEITGPIPSLAGLSSLQELNVHDNGFSSIPSDFFTGMVSLQTAILDNNPFSPWEIPESIRDATSLQEFSASNCSISGEIPVFFGSQTFPGLTQLHLGRNLLQGQLPSSFSGSAIQSLLVNGQKGETKLNGSISVLQNMTSLTEVWLHGNHFSGPIPDLSGLTSLKNFSVRDNQLTGIVPPSLVKLKSLFVVNLTNNLLQGPTPDFDTNRVRVDMAPGLNSFCLDDPGLPCDPRVDILLSIIEPLGFPIRFAESWKGNDPCDGWLGIACSGQNITVINFKNMELSGTISPTFSNLTSLETINLAQNRLTGTIPLELTGLPRLTTLDVSRNRLFGKVPNFRKVVSVNTDGNPDIRNDRPFAPSGSPSTPSVSASGDDRSPRGNNSKTSTGVLVGSVVGSLCGVIVVGLVIWLFIRKQKRTDKVQRPSTVIIHPQHSGNHDNVKINVVAASGGADGSGSRTTSSSGPSDIHVVEAGNMVIAIQVLREVTNNFSQENVLGKGGFGTVYKGELPDGTKIAVKRMEASVMNEKGLAEFRSEITVLTKVRHRNLVALLGYCLDGNERLLVYEYMPQGTLSRHLFHWAEEGLKRLEWTKRLTIALDVARGVEYLHTLAHQSFIHRDLKPSNILLGDDMHAKVSDFGLVRLAPEGKQSIETRLAGTFGYLAPEYAVTGRVTTKVDVFSFGVILMEMITGRKALDESQPEDSSHLVPWFRRMFINKESFEKAIESTIQRDEETVASINKVAELACHCCGREPQHRPDMSHVVNVISSLVEQWKPSEPEDPDDVFGIDFDMPLLQALKKWQDSEGASNVEDSSSFNAGSSDNTQTSIPPRPPGFASSFASADGR